MAKRVSLTEKQLESAAGAELLALCKSITSDGAISTSEIVALAKWLQAHQENDHIPAVSFLSEIVTRIIADKRVTKDELAELHAAIRKVLPPDERKAAAEAREAKQPPAAYCPYCNAPFKKMPKRGADCPDCGQRYHAIDGKVITTAQYRDLGEQRDLQYEIKRRGGRTDGATAEQVAVMMSRGVSIPKYCTEEQAWKIIKRVERHDDPTDEETEQWEPIVTEIRTRIRTGESMDSIIAKPPRAAGSASALHDGFCASDTGGSGCASVILCIVVGIVYGLCVT